MSVTSDNEIYVGSYEPDEHYAMIRSWHENQAHCLPKDDLPNGLVAVWNGKYVAALFIYLTSNSRVCFLDHALGRPNMPPKILKRALVSLVEQAEVFAKANGNGAIRVFSDHIAITRCLQRDLGFSKEIDVSDQLFKII